MTLSHILQKIFLPGEVLAKKTAGQIVAHPKAAANGIHKLLQHIDNTCHSYGVACSGPKGELAKSVLVQFCRDRPDAPTLSQARQVTQSLKYIKRDFESQVPGAMLKAGKYPSWYNERADAVKTAVHLASKLRHFQGPTSRT